jgi:hypothetical protein
VLETARPLFFVDWVLEHRWMTFWDLVNGIGWDLGTGIGSLVASDGMKGFYCGAFY